MTQRGPFLFLVALLLLAGIGVATFRHLEYRIPLLPGAQQTVWEVEARIEFMARGQATQAYLTLPPNQDGLRLISETHGASGFGFEQGTQRSQRRAHWTKRNAQGEQILFYKLQLVQDPSYRVDSIPPENVAVTSWDEPYRTAARQVVDTALPISADGRTLAQQLINNMNLIPADQNVSLLRDRYDDPTLLARLLRSADVTARKVQVLALEDGRRRQALLNYVQVWDVDRWYLFNPRIGPVTELDNLLLWQTDTPAVLEVLGGSRSRVSFSMISQDRDMLTLAEESLGFGFSLYNLPIAEQGMFKLIMLLPVGALVVVFMRLLVGVRTAGTFMPVLIALAFLQTELIPGVLSFVLVVSIGLVIRSYLSELNLLLVARIATLVIVVIGIISVFSVMSYRLGLMGGLTISFFPMIILAWTIERMSIIWEEEGPREVLVQGGGSLLVAVLALLLMDLNVVRHLVFNFPELHLCVLALVMVLGRYTGYRLLELNRFASMKDA
jgi:hypothetical protein